MFLPFVQPAFAQSPQEWLGTYCVGTNIAEDVATIRGIECVVFNLLRMIPSVLALVAVGMIIMAGVRLMTAGADPKAWAAAWQQLTWAVVGLILLAGVWLVLVAIQTFTGAEVTNFGFPTP